MTGLTMKTTPDLMTYLDDNNMNELGAASLGIEWVEVLKLIGYGIFAALVWILKKFGEAHLASIKDLALELREMRKDLNALASRVTVIEARAENIAHHEP